MHWLLKMLSYRDQCEIKTQALKCATRLVGLTLVFKRHKMSSLLPHHSAWTRALSPISVHPLVLEDGWTWVELPVAVRIEELRLGSGQLVASPPCFR